MIRCFLINLKEQLVSNNISKSRITTISGLISAFLLLGSLIGCSQKSSQGDRFVAGDLFANRPTQRQMFIAIIKLKGASLYEDVRYDDAGVATVERARADSLVREQMEMEARLQKLAQDHQGTIKVLFRYRYVLNALAVSASSNLLPQLETLGGISYIERETPFTRPEVIASSALNALLNKAIDQKVTSATHIGADRVRRELGIDGSGVKVGIVDTGIDYTHSMLGGSGRSEDYEAIDPAGAATGFPNERVVGGKDFCGTDYDSASPIEEKLMPRPDENPLDEQGHGTHVAGSVAGHGDGKESYDGVAPGAKLYALKVFGKDGSTGDAVILAALEYAADPNVDFDISDRLDVLNMSLGSDFGKPHIMYSEAIDNLARAGVVVVASAGNSGDVPYITGAPATSVAAISVAASVDSMDHNWKFSAIEFTSAIAGEDNKKWSAEAIEASFTTPIAQMEERAFEMVAAGFADEDFSPDLAQRVAGKVAFISRGRVAFSEKIKRAAKAGAAGVVVYNNQDGSAFVMGGSDDQVAIPAVMITKELGQEFLARLERGTVTVQFNTTLKIERPEYIDTLTSFSSRGPRSQDSLIKPEIAAPGSDIISAKVGGGSEVESMSGTSMAAPHVAGVMALMKAKFPKATVAELKARVMGSAKTIQDAKKSVYAVALQGAGRVQVYEAISTNITANPAALSLGQIPLGKKKSVVRQVILTNHSQQAQTYKLNVVTGKGLEVDAPASVAIAANGSATVVLRFNFTIGVDSDGAQMDIAEMDGRLEALDNQGQRQLVVPFLAVLRGTSAVVASQAQIFASGPYDAAGAQVQVELDNRGAHPAQVFAFNLLGRDQRQLPGDQVLNSTRSRACDLQSAGHRIIERETANGQVRFLQVAVKLYHPLTRWQTCDVSVLIDADGDGEAEQELVGLMHEKFPGMNGDQYSSLLLDYKMARRLRKEFEEAQGRGEDVKEDYTSSIVQQSGMLAFEHSSLAIIEAPVAKLAKRVNGDVAIKLVVSNEDRAAIEFDDYLGLHGDQWENIDLGPLAMSMMALDEKTLVPAGEKKIMLLTKGETRSELVLYAPTNRTVQSDSLLDDVQLDVIWEYRP
jgi:subtilisin family serine protease